MGGDNAPAFGHFYPGLHLATDLRTACASKLRAGDGHIMTIGGDDRITQGSVQTGRGASEAKGTDFLDPI